MSRTLNTSEDRKNSSRDAYLELSRMLRQGRSWSGRERNNAFLNTGDGRFANVAATTGFDFPDDARAVSVVDWDQDGDQDLWVSNRNQPRLRLLRNGAAAPAGVALLLEGTGAGTNSTAVGARATLDLTGPGIRLVRSVRAGEGYLAQSSRWLHFGLRPGQKPSRLSIDWPGGEREEIAGIGGPGRYRVAQGSGRADRLPAPPPASALRPSAPAGPAASSVARLPLSALLRWPRGLQYTRFDGAAAVLEPAPGRPLLVNLFASWCAPCAGELEGWSRDAASLRAAGIDVVALAVDGLGDDRSDPERAEEMLARAGFPFASGRATSGILTVLQAFNNVHVSLHRSLPVPTSFLVDARGRLAFLYKGPVAAAQVIADAALPEGTRELRIERAAPLGGRVLAGAAVEAARVENEASQRFLFALGLAEQGRHEDARAHYEDVLALKPDFPEAQINLGLALLHLGREAEAERAFNAVLAARADLASAHFNLGALHDRRGDLARAEAGYREALRLKPEHREAHNAWGLICAKTGRMAEALAHFQAEIAINPGFAEAHNNLGLASLEHGRNAEAQRSFEAALELAPQHADAHNNLGVVHKRLGRVDDAIRHYQQAIAANPRFAEAWNNLGLAHLGAGREDAAREAFEKAVSVEPGFTPAARNLERMRSRQK